MNLTARSTPTCGLKEINTRAWLRISGRRQRLHLAPPTHGPATGRADGPSPRWVDGRSDVFSLGVVLYELLTRQRPFVGTSMEEIMRLVAEAEPRPPRQLEATIPRELEPLFFHPLVPGFERLFIALGLLAMPR
jgi:hypothetical protein